MAPRGRSMGPTISGGAGHDRNALARSPLGRHATAHLERSRMTLGNLEIARAATLLPIEDIARDMGLDRHLVEPYGRDVMKVSLDAIKELADRPRAKYVMVTAITPTPLGEGKTTTSVGLSQ